MQIDLKSKQICGVWITAGLGRKQGGSTNGLLKKINRPIKLIRKEIKREDSEHKAGVPSSPQRHAACSHRLKVLHLKAAIEGYLPSIRAQRDRALIGCS